MSKYLNVNSKHFTYSKKKMRPPLFAMSQMFPNPPKSTDPCAMMAIRPAITTKVWNVSVHTTARRPPCSNRCSSASELMKLRDFQRFEILKLTNTFKTQCCIWYIDLRYTRWAVLCLHMNKIMFTFVYILFYPTIYVHSKNYRCTY